MNIEKLIVEERVKILFQPIVSIKNKKTIGYEVLSRGIDENGGQIGAAELFSAAKNNNKLFQLDSLCRNIAVRNCKELMQKGKHLFLNYDISDLNKDEKVKYKLEESLKELAEKLDFYSIDRNHVVIEVIESNVEKMDNLLFFRRLCKKLGFLIALDDVGSGHSNLNRIPLIKPDIIKIDRYLVQNIQNDYYKQEVFKSITSMCRKIGILVISEGVETESEALQSIELRADMIQGYYIRKPIDNFSDEADYMINKLHDAFKFHFDQKILAERDKNILFLDYINNLSHKLKNYKLNQIFFEKNKKRYSDLKDFLIKSIKKFDYIECIYLMNKDGIQITETFFKEEIKRKYRSSLFFPAEIGEDHSLKQYFFKLHTNQTEAYISDKYISMATGNLCRTLSAYINEDIVLAVDINKSKYSEALC